MIENQLKKSVAELIHSERKLVNYGFDYGLITVNSDTDIIMTLHK